MPYRISKKAKSPTGKPSKVNPDVDAAMKGKKGKRPVAVQKVKPRKPANKSLKGRSRAEKMDRGERLSVQRKKKNTSSVTKKRKKR